MGQDEFMRSRVSMLAEMRVGFGLGSPRQHAIVPTVVERPVEELMAELRRDHPREAMLLGEFVVPDDPKHADALRDIAVESDQEGAG